MPGILASTPWAERKGLVREALFVVLRGSIKTLDTRTVNDLVAARLAVSADKTLARVINALAEEGHAVRSNETFKAYGRTMHRWVWPPMAPVGAKAPAACEDDIWTVRPTASLPACAVAPYGGQDAKKIAAICEAEGIDIYEYVSRYCK